jgi:hypothetical protein
MSESEVKRLRAELRETRAKLKATTRQLEELRASQDARIGEAVKAAVDELQRDIDRAAAEWRAEREQLQNEIQKLRARAAPLPEERPPVPTDVLADQLRGVLDRLGEPSPAPGRQSAAALSTLEVEARGVLVPSAKEGQAPDFVTVDPTQVPTETLSTVRMRFTLLPQIGPPPA